jgi:hypothetical protein
MRPDTGILRPTVVPFYQVLLISFIIRFDVTKVNKILPLTSFPQFFFTNKVPSVESANTALQTFS